MKLHILNILTSDREIDRLTVKKKLILTVNAHSFNVAQEDVEFAHALQSADVLLPDGAGIVWACKLLRIEPRPKKRITGWDLFESEMNKLNASGEKDGIKVKVFFLGSSERTLELIRDRASVDYPNLEVITYSPPYKETFSEVENAGMIDAINSCNPDLLWVGMTAPKQEKWLWEHWEELDIHCHVGAIGAVFDFYAGTVKRAPVWMQRSGLEWFYRLLSDPKRMWRRYLIGNAKYIFYIVKELIG